MASLISVASEGRVLVVRLDRPPHNALDAALADAIDEALDQAIRSDMAVLHLRSDAGGFCGGAHPDRLAAWLDKAAGADALVADGRRFHALFRRIETAPLVVLAEISGMALGAGLGLALACDLRIAGEDARLGVPEARFGVLPAGQTIARIVRIAGPQVARRLLFAGSTINAGEALGLGLVDWIAPAAALAAQAAATAQRIAGLSPLALREAKAIIDTAPADQGNREEAALRALLASAPDHRRLADLVGKLT